MQLKLIIMLRLQLIKKQNKSKLILLYEKTMKIYNKNLFFLTFNKIKSLLIHKNIQFLGIKVWATLDLDVYSFRFIDLDLYRFRFVYLVNKMYFCY